jgi:CrcB protein
VVPPSLLVLLGAGYCGTLTTFSGFMGQVDNRLRHKATRALAIRYVSGVTFAGMALAGIAYRLAAGA